MLPGVREFVAWKLGWPRRYACVADMPIGEGIALEHCLLLDFDASAAEAKEAEEAAKRSAADGTPGAAMEEAVQAMREMAALANAAEWDRISKGRA
jgi:hypothetical protein